MADVKIRKLPDWVVDFYKKSAERAGRSLEEELRVLLTENTQAKRQEWAARIDKLHKSWGKRRIFPNMVLEEREERERKG
jgi:plasmid stability protein